jgi:hypothetical protein
MHDVLAMCRVDGSSDLNGDHRCFGWIDVAFCLGVSFEQLSGRPFDGEKWDSAFSFACFDCANDVTVLYTGAELRFANETRDGSGILTQPFAQHLECYSPVLRVMSLVNGGRAAFTDLSVDRVAGNRRSHQILSWHSANLMRIGRQGQGQEAI